jgi:hypothetical protein
MESERVRSIDVGREAVVRARGVGEVLWSDNESLPISTLLPRSCRSGRGGVLEYVPCVGGLGLGA